MHYISTDLEKAGIHLKATSGSSYWVKLNFHDSIIVAYQTLKKQGFNILATYASENNIDYWFVDFTNQTVIILGTKLSGLTSEAIK